MRRPAAVAFDVIETLFPIEPLRARLVDAGLPRHALETWFAGLLRDAFALDATGVYHPFRAVAMSGLQAQLAKAGREADPDWIETIISGFAELDAHPDVAPAMNILRDASVRIFTLTNGSAGVTGKLLLRAGVADLVERTVSIDEVQHWKPNRAVYLHCAEGAGVAPEDLALVAAHGWDIHGAASAGLITGFVARQNEPFPATMRAPDVSGSTLTEVVEALLRRS